MNGRGGCCIARHDGGGMYGMSKVAKIMLKFRPIAPKPMAAGSGSTTENSDGYVKCKRGKRKYVRVNGKKKKDDNSKRSRVENERLRSRGEDAVVTTLSLLPETPDRKENSPAKSFADLLSPAKCNCSNKRKSAPVWLSFDKREQKVGGFDRVVVKPPPPPRRAQLVSYVTVECVSTDTWVGIGCTDQERVMNMEMDTCPGFISDSQDRVVWTNKAFRQMVGGEDVSVVLVRKDNWTPSPVPYPAFTCKVRITSAAHCDSTAPSPPSPTRTLPCDVWRMERGACAWRLDVKAALSLGR